MIAPQSEIDQIRSARTRRRELHRPVEHGEHGERKKCQFREGKAYELHPPVEYGAWKEEARSQPSRPAAVLWLIDRCLIPVRRVTVTVTLVEMLRDEKGDPIAWRIVFAKGDQTGKQDRPRFLAAKPGAPHGDYVSSSALGLPGEREAVEAAVLEEYVKDAEDRQSHADWEPVHGPAERIATELPGMRTQVGKLRQELADKGTSDRMLEMEIERVEKGIELAEGALARIRSRLAEAA